MCFDPYQDVGALASDSWLKFTRWLTGPWTLVRVPTPEQEKTVFELNTSKGTFNIYCHPVRYIRKFQRWWVPNHHHRLFLYYLVSDEDALPVEMREAMRQISHLPDLKFSYLTPKQQSKLMLSAYLDVLLQDLETKKE